MPKVRVALSLVAPPCEVFIVKRYSGWSPIWYGHHSFGWSMWTGSNVSVLLSPAARLTVWWTLIGLPPLGSVIVASTSPVWAVPVVFLTVPLSVRSVLDM